MIKAPDVLALFEKKEGSLLDNKTLPKEGSTVWFLSGQMGDTIRVGEIIRIDNIDKKGLSNTYFTIMSSGKEYRCNISQTYDHKPRKVKWSDEYGEVMVWR